MGTGSSCKCDSGTQTDIHPIETNIDKSYEWNEWELRRKALQLVRFQVDSVWTVRASPHNPSVFLTKQIFSDLDSKVNLRKKVTHSSQTNQSHMRRENATQTWLQKDAACQSKRDCGSNATVPHVYLAGVTGQKQAHVVKVNLSKPAYED